MNNQTYETHEPHIARHYTHAKEKHPFFADDISIFKCDEVSEQRLEIARKRLCIGRTYADEVLYCEVDEMILAYNRGEKAHAIEECYDAVAVLLRMADMIKAEMDQEAAK